MAYQQGWVYEVKGEGPAGSHLDEPVLYPSFMVLDGRNISIYLNDPSEKPNEKPVRRALAGTSTGVEDLGRRTFLPTGTVLHVFRVYNKQDPFKAGGVLGCPTAEAAQQWIEALHPAHEEGRSGAHCFSKFISHLFCSMHPPEGDKMPLLSQSKARTRRRRRAEREVKSSRSSLDLRDGSSRTSHRAHVPDLHNPLPGFHRLISIGKGILSDKSSNKRAERSISNGSDALDAADWRIFKVADGLRYFEDIEAAKQDPQVSVIKAVGVVDATADAVFELLMGTDKEIRSQWDPLTWDMWTVEVIDGHNDIVHCHIHAKYLKQWSRDRDFVSSRYWRIDQDGSYSITQFATTHPNAPERTDVLRIANSPGTWEIHPLPSVVGGVPRCIVRHSLELTQTGWAQWRPTYFKDFEETVPYMACQRIAGMREYFAARFPYVQPAGESLRGPAVVPDKTPRVGTPPRTPPPGVHSRGVPVSPQPSAAAEHGVELYDCIALPYSVVEMLARSSSIEAATGQRMNRLPSMHDRTPEGSDSAELDSTAAPAKLDLALLQGSLRQCQGPKDSSCWLDPGGDNFAVRGPNYLMDKIKVPAGDPLLKLVAVDWMKADNKVDNVATRPGCLVQTKAGQKVPFFLVINLQVPGKPSYSQVFYFAADRPIRKGSLLDKFANGSDKFRNSRLKLIPRIVEGYWVVKKAVGTKACLLGKAVACNYLRKDNFLEIDCDIGSSSVARGIIGVVIGYVTSLVVDMAILIQGEEEEELPEYLLAAMRIVRLKLEDAVSVR